MAGRPRLSREGPDRFLSPLNLAPVEVSRYALGDTSLPVSFIGSFCFHLFVCVMRRGGECVCVCVRGCVCVCVCVMFLVLTMVYQTLIHPCISVSPVFSFRWCSHCWPRSPATFFSFPPGRVAKGGDTLTPHETPGASAGGLSCRLGYKEAPYHLAPAKP